MPPLRERRDDIAPLAERFLRQAAQENERTVTGIEPEALKLLENYPWPGNIRELRHTMERMVVLAKGETLTADDVPDNIRNGIPATTRETPAAPEESGKEAVLLASGTLDDNERKLIEDALRRCGGNRTKAAQMLGISRRTLHRRLQEYALTDQE
jgi:DNA-binding NtrC family response regulator